jgi:hypothetical protein
MHVRIHLLSITTPLSPCQIANGAGWALAFIAYLKARFAPTHINDNKWSGSFWYDLFMGVEHNPRLSSHPYSFDFKVLQRLNLEKRRF